MPNPLLYLSESKSVQATNRKCSQDIWNCPGMASPHHQDKSSRKNRTIIYSAKASLAKTRLVEIPKCRSISCARRKTRALPQNSTPSPFPLTKYAPACTAPRKESRQDASLPGWNPATRAPYCYELQISWFYFVSAIQLAEQTQPSQTPTKSLDAN